MGFKSKPEQVYSLKQEIKLPPVNQEALVEVVNNIGRKRRGPITDVKFSHVSQCKKPKFYDLTNDNSPQKEKAKKATVKQFKEAQQRLKTQNNSLTASHKTTEIDECMKITCK